MPSSKDAEWKKRQKRNTTASLPFVHRWLRRCWWLFKWGCRLSVFSLLASVVAAEALNFKSLTDANAHLDNAQSKLAAGVTCRSSGRADCKLHFARSHDAFTSAMNLYNFAVVAEKSKAERGDAAVLRLLRMPGLVLRHYMGAPDSWVHIKSRLREHMQRAADAIQHQQPEESAEES
jgi:hypothetical protein